MDIQEIRKRGDPYTIQDVMRNYQDVLEVLEADLLAVRVQEERVKVQIQTVRMFLEDLGSVKKIPIVAQRK